ncbi:flagellar hook-length control protein FliK [Sulfurirhabdus autotrophica]|uniref:Flagellar hook-length control protein FliK n=1 Tax=Sulfurirhabdus autotrophica TaxID=1706046 RepID=A0A4R3YF75_9PROT|nr:flagellar hook-length control protein FliK [Sulfurirhabdus autotrophica]TCV90776.1 flagellar hook-length control protein FliK [Sulfurirhabdus autotrophica]
MNNLMAPASTAHIQVVQSSNAAAKSGNTVNSSADSNSDSSAKSSETSGFGALLQKQISATSARPEEAKSTKELKSDEVTENADNASLQGANQQPNIATLFPVVAQNIAPQAFQIIASKTDAGQSRDIKIGPSVGKGGQIDLSAPEKYQGVKNQAAEIAGDGKLFRAADLGKALQTPADSSKEFLTSSTNTNSQLRTDGLSTLTVNQLNSQPLQTNLVATVDPKVGAPGWDNALGQKIAWIATQTQKTAELHLNPPNLGPLEVRLTIANDQTTAQFVSHHPAVRDAIEAALPRLREMLADNGLTLGDVSVSSQSFSQQHAFSGEEGQRGKQNNVRTESFSDALIVQSTAPTAIKTRGNGMVNTFA